MAINLRVNKGSLQTRLTHTSQVASPSIKEEDNYLDDEVNIELRLEDLRTRKEYNDLLAQNRHERKKYARYIFLLTCIWATLIFLIVIAVGFGSDRRPFSFHISDTVLVTLISTTTINFFGFFLLVVKYLFYTGQETSKDSLADKNDKNAA